MVGRNIQDWQNLLKNIYEYLQGCETALLFTIGKILLVQDERIF